ncbi:hypothetical protein BDV06DRAFT_192176 [Aspergillus oleicola]
MGFLLVHLRCLDYSTRQFREPDQRYCRRPSIPQGLWRLFRGDYVLDTTWRAVFSGAPVASMIVGALVSAQIADWIGRRNTIVLALCISFGAVTLEFIATTNEPFFGGKFLNGLCCWRIAGCLCYVHWRGRVSSFPPNIGLLADHGQIVPLALRSLMTCLIALAYTLGPFTVALIGGI